VVFDIVENHDLRLLIWF